MEVEQADPQTEDQKMTDDSNPRSSTTKSQQLRLKEKTASSHERETRPNMANASTPPTPPLAPLRGATARPLSTT